MSDVMQRDPVLIPRKPGVFALLNKKRRLAYVAYSSDLQKRSHSLAHMLQNPRTHWSLKDLPKHPAGEFMFTVVADDVPPDRAPRFIGAAERSARSKNYRVVEGSRSAVPMVHFDGDFITLADAMVRSRCKTKYITVWRRLDRGWSVEQALGLDPPPIRWDPDQTEARRKRAAKKRHAN